MERTIVAILVEGHPRKFLEIIYEIGPLVEEEMSFFFLFLALSAILFSGAKPF